MSNQATTTGQYYRRVLVREWIENYYDGNHRPARQTIIRRLEEGRLAGSDASGDWVIYCNDLYEPVTPANYKPKSATAVSSAAQSFLDNMLKVTAQ